MKYIFIALALLVTSIAHSESVEVMTDEIIPFAYESRAKIVTSDENMARYLSVEYRTERDEFVKHDMLNKIKPVIKDTLNERKTISNYRVKVGTKIGKYDFNRDLCTEGH